MTASPPTQKDVAIVLKAIFHPELRITGPSRIEATKRVGNAMFGDGFDPQLHADALVNKIKSILEGELTALREKWNVTLPDEKTTVEAQLRRDFEPKQVELEKFSVLWARYICGYNRASIIQRAHISSRTYDYRLLYGRERLAALISPVMSPAPRDTAPDEPEEAVRDAARTPQVVASAAPQESVVESAPHRLSMTTPRDSLIAQVRRTWITGVFRKNMHGRQPIVLQLQNKPQTIRGRWSDVVQEAGQDEGFQPDDYWLEDVWELYESELLLLGKAGAGKTTALLQLANVLLDEAERNEHAPVPVVFHLGSWAEKCEPITQWLVHELWKRYSIDVEWSHQAIVDRMLVVLVDGLDEVAEDYQRECVEAINVFRSDHRTIGMALCCRSETMQDLLPARLSLSGAVELQPLSPFEIEQRLETIDGMGDIEHASLPDDHPMYKLLATPLMLDTFIETYGSVKPASFADTTLPQFRQSLFEGYIKKVFQRREEPLEFEKDDTARWLMWLARQMNDHKKTFFEIEELDSSWLQPMTRKRFIRLIRILRGLTLGIFIGCIGAPLLMMVVGNILGSTFGMTLRFQTTIFVILSMIVVLVLVYSGVGLRAIKDDTQERIRPVERFEKARPFRRRWLLLTAVISLTLLVLSSMLYGVGWGLVYALAPSVVLTSMVLFSSYDGEVAKKRTEPNQGISLSGRHALQYGGLAFLVCTLGLGVTTSLIVPPGTAWSVALIVGFGISLFVMFAYGGEAWVMHWLLRRALGRERVIPPDLPRFLEFAVERVLMYRVDGRYLFFHGLFQEHLAMRTTDHRPPTTDQ